MRRAIPAVSILAFVFLSVSVAPARAQLGAAASAADKARKEKDKDKSKEQKPPKVYTNDDLEETTTRPSKVQDLTAQGVEAYTPPQELSTPDTSSELPQPAAEQMSERDMRVKEAEDNVKSLEQTANALLWQYLQSGDSNEILRLKSEQQAVLEQLEQAKAELARLKAEESRPGPSTAPTPPPG